MAGHTHSQRYEDAKKKLDNAISEFNLVNAEEHDDEDSKIVVGWLLVTASTNYAEYGAGIHYAWNVPENQPWHHSAGLARYVAKSLDASIEEN